MVAFMLLKMVLNSVNQNRISAQENFFLTKVYEKRHEMRGIIFLMRKVKELFGDLEGCNC